MGSKIPQTRQKWFQLQIILISNETHDSVCCAPIFFIVNYIHTAIVLQVN